MSNNLLRRAFLRLSHPGVGIGFALLTAVLAALGSAAYGLVPELYRYRLWNDWSAPRWHTISVYLVLALLVAWGLHAGLRFGGALRDSAGPPAGRLSRLVLGMVQLDVVLALGVGLWLVVRPPPEEFVVTQKGTEVHGEVYRVLRIEKGDWEATPPRRTVSWLERRVGGTTSQIRVQSRRYWASTTAAYDLMVARAQMTTDGAIVRRGSQRVALSPDKQVGRGPNTLLLRGFRSGRSGREGRVPDAELKIGGQEAVLPFDPEWAGENAFLGLKESPVCLLRGHRNLCVPLAAVAALLVLFSGLLWGLARRTPRSAT